MRLDNIKIRDINKNIFFLLFFLYFLLKPFYIFSSGIPQPSDFILLVVFFFIFMSGDLYIEKVSQDFLLSNLIFVIYIIGLNGFWALRLGGETDFIIYSSYYLFNFIVVVITLHLYSKFGERLLRVINYAIISSIGLQLLALIISGGFDGTRSTLFFNNPNQLGYFGLLSMALIVFINNHFQKRIMTGLITIIGPFVLILTSLSKAAIISGIFMLIIYLFSYGNKRNIIKIAVVIVMILAILFVSYRLFDLKLNEASILFESVYWRLSSIGSDFDDNLAGRGYDRIVNHPQYLFVGAGEGVMDRFDSLIPGEIHSTFGNILFSYGTIGILIFSYILLSIVRGKKIREIYPLIFVFMYSFTHNGIRQSMLWVLMSLIAATVSDSSSKIEGNHHLINA